MKNNTDDPQLESKKRALSQHRAFALALLAVATVLFGATFAVPDPGFWILLLRAGAEAGLIGGLADWFAVTALFRRPFGLPIPHTAIIPRNKARIGQGLARFVERNFLEPEVIFSRMREGNLAARIGRWLGVEANSRTIAEQLTALAPDVIHSLDDREVREFFRDTFSEQVARADLVPVLSRVLRLLVESGHHQKLFERFLEIAQHLLAQNEDTILERVERRTAWWIPSQVDRKLAEALVHGIDELLTELADPDHEGRRRLDDAVWKLVDRLEHSERFRSRVEALKTELLGSPELHTAFGSVWDELKVMMLAELERPDSAFRATLTRSLQALGATLAKEPDAQIRLNRRLEGLVQGFVVPFRFQIGRFIADVVDSWDTETVTERLELEVGRDLQFIRMNGTLVGALAGCVLFLLTHYVH